MKLMSKLKFFIVCTLAICCVVFTGCSDDDDNVTSLSLSNKRLSFSSGTGSVDITLSTSSKWKSRQDVDWINCSPSSAKGDATLTVSVTTNNSAKERSGYIAIKNDDDRHDTIRVLQTGNVPMIALSQYEASVQKSGTSLVIMVASNVGEWEMSTDDGWIILPTSTSSTSNYFTLRVINNSYLERTGKVTFKQVNGSVRSELIINQAATTESLNRGADSTALVALYNALNGSNWSRKWTLTESMTSWYGIELTDDRVTSISLNNNKLTGSIPSEIANLAELKVLQLEGNALSGSLPQKMSELKKLEVLNLSKNKYEGNMPAVIGQITSLKQLNLSYNKFSNFIDFSSLTNLEELLITDNTTLSVQLPSSIGKLKKLKKLHLNNNKLSGTIPADLGGLTALTELKLFSNELTGAIPEAFQQLVALEQLELQDNKLTGTIPENLGNLTQVKLLDLSANQLTGAIPEKLGNASKLETLFLQDNQLSGNIPKTFTALSNISALYLSNNDLTGAILAEIGKLQKLKLLYLNGNKLDGTIPADLLSHPNWNFFEICNQQSGFGFSNCP